MHYVVVVCDDEEDIRFLENAFLSVPGNFVTNIIRSAGNCLEQLHADAGHASPCLIIINNYLPDMDSLDLLQQIKGAPLLKLIPVAVMAGFASEELIKSYYLAGANCFYKKPLDEHEWQHMADCLITLFCPS